MKKRELEYVGPKLPRKKRGRTSYAVLLSALKYAKDVFAQSGRYGEAMRIRDIERNLEDELNAKIKKTKT